VKSDAVSRQDTDTFVNQAAATAAAVKSAQANVQRLKELQSFEKVYAPFDGVVTARNIDTGPVDRPGRPRSCFTCRPSRPCASTPTCRRSTPQA
jgi:multidrug efflux pump subunit AcrA (membrane-fusion protein)